MYKTDYGGGRGGGVKISQRWLRNKVIYDCEQPLREESTISNEMVVGSALSHSTRTELDTSKLNCPALYSALVLTSLTLLTLWGSLGFIPRYQISV